MAVTSTPEPTLRERHVRAVDQLAWWREREAIVRGVVAEAEARVATLQAELDAMETPLPGALQP